MGPIVHMPKPRPRGSEEVPRPGKDKMGMGSGCWTLQDGWLLPPAAVASFPRAPPGQRNPAPAPPAPWALPMTGASAQEALNPSLPQRQLSAHLQWRKEAHRGLVWAARGQGEATALRVCPEGACARRGGQSQGLK